jgi:hypothetical protein
MAALACAYVSLEGGDNFCFVGGGLLQGFRIDPCRRGSSNKLIEVVVGSAGVQENFGNGANIRGRTPRVFIRRDGLGKANEFAFLNHDLAITSDRYPVTPGVPSRYG